MSTRRTRGLSPAALAMLTEKETPVIRRSSLELVTLGTDEHGREIQSDDLARLEHMLVVGSSGSGKSNFLLHLCLQIIANRRGLLLIDPHGSHHASLMLTVLRFMQDRGWLGKRRVHIIAPNIKACVTGFNPLQPIADCAPSVIGGAMAIATSRVWGDEDTSEKPLVRKMIQLLFTVLADQRLTVADMLPLVDFGDTTGLRRRVISQLLDDHLRGQMEALHEISERPRARSEYDINIMGPINRVAELLAHERMRQMLGMSREFAPMPAHTIDFLEVMNRGDIVVMDCSPGPLIDENAARVLGTMTIRYLHLLMKFRTPFRLPGDDRPHYHPFFIMVDEAALFLTEDVASLLAEGRKFGVGVIAALQYMAQAGKPGDKIYEALRNVTESKVIFRVKSPEEAQMWAPDVLEIDLEMPVQASIRPVVVAHEIGSLTGSNFTVQEGEGTSEGKSRGRAFMESLAESRNWTRSTGTTDTTSSSSAIGSSDARSNGSSSMRSSSQADSNSMSYSYDPQANQFLFAPNLPLNQIIGKANMRGTAEAAGVSDNRSRGTSRVQQSGNAHSVITMNGEGGGTTHSTAVTASVGTTTSRSRNRATTVGRSENQALIPIYADLATSFHPLTNVLFMAAEKIRYLPIGTCYVRYRNVCARVLVPPPPK